MRFGLNITAPAAMAAALALTAAGCRPAPAPSGRVVDPVHGIEFDAPAGWAIETPTFTGETFSQYEAPDGNGALYIGVRTDPAFLFGGIGAVFVSFIQYLTDPYPDFTIITNTPGKLNDVEVMRFDAMLGGEPLSGACLRQGADEYFVVMCAWKKTAVDKDLLERVLASIRVTGTRHGSEVEKKFRAQIKPLASMDEVREALRFGQQLLAARDVEMGNYARAINIFMRALVTMQAMDPPPPEQHDALSALLLARVFQRTEYRELQVAVEQALALRARDDAMHAADRIMKLYPDNDSTPYRYALKRWKAAAALPAPSAGK